MQRFRQRAVVRAQRAQREARLLGLLELVGPDALLLEIVGSDGYEVDGLLQRVGRRIGRNACNRPDHGILDAPECQL